MVCLHYTRQGGTLSRLIFRDLSRHSLILTCSLPTEQVRWSRGRYEDAAASSTVPRGLVVLAVRLFMTCSLLISYAVYKESALFFGFYSGFTRGEYHVIRVDFIVALRRSKGRRRWTLRSPSPPSSGLHLLTPGCPLRRGISAAAGLGQYSQLVSGAGRSSPLRYIVWVLCVRAWTVRVSVDFVGHMSFVFHYWMEKRRC